jgi:hypothetical protein
MGRSPTERYSYCNMGEMTAAKSKNPGGVK